jgi:hypothetical protein
LEVPPQEHRDIKRIHDAVASRQAAAEVTASKVDAALVVKTNRVEVRYVLPVGVAHAVAQGTHGTNVQAFHEAISRYSTRVRIVVSMHYLFVPELLHLGELCDDVSIVANP